MNGSNNAIIRLENLSKCYRKNKRELVQAVDNLSLTVPQGQVLGFLGENGAGKTTTIKMMCGLVLPTTGRVQLNGIDVAGQWGLAMRQIGAVLEGTRNVYWRLTALQNLIYFGRLQGVWGRVLRRRAEQLLRDLDLWERRNDLVKDFSRGMQQKVAIAGALIADPSIVLLDEPTLGLDVNASRTVKEWVKRLSQEEGRTVILTTHQLNMAEELCDRVAIMRRGRLIADEPTDRLLDLFRQESYQICVEGHVTQEALQENWVTVDVPNDDVTVTYQNGHTNVMVNVTEEARLYALLTQIRQLNYPLISVERTEPNLEEVFVQLTKETIQ